MKNKVNLNEVLEQLLLGRIHFIDVEICADNSSVLITNNDGIYFEEKNINYNDVDLVDIRVYFQNFIKNKRVKILLASQRRIGTDYYLEVSTQNNPIYFKYTSEGISNKYNRLKIEKVSIVSDNYYSTREVAEKLRVNIMTIYRYIKTGRLQAYKIGKEFRINKDEFNKFLDKVKTKQ